MGSFMVNLNGATVLVGMFVVEVTKLSQFDLYLIMMKLNIKTGS